MSFMFEGVAQGAHACMLCWVAFRYRRGMSEGEEGIIEAPLAVTIHQQVVAVEPSARRRHPLASEPLALVILSNISAHAGDLGAKI